MSAEVRITMVLMVCFTSIILTNCNHDQGSNFLIGNEYIDSETTNSPVLYCMDIKGESQRICEYQISSLVNDSYYKGFCILDNDEQFDSENITSLDYDLISNITDDNTIIGCKFNCLGTNEYEANEVKVNSIVFKGIELLQNNVNCLQGYSTVDCNNETYSFVRIEATDYKLLFHVLINKQNSSESSSGLDTIIIEIPKYQSRIIEDNGRLLHIYSESLLFEKGKLKHYNGSKLDSLGVEMDIVCRKSIDFIPVHRIQVHNLDLKGCFLKESKL